MSKEVLKAMKGRTVLVVLLFVPLSAAWSVSKLGPIKKPFTPVNTRRRATETDTDIIIAKPSIESKWAALSEILKLQEKADETETTGGNEFDLNEQRGIQVVQLLENMKADKDIALWNSTRLINSRVTVEDVRMYCRMREDLEKALGFTSSPAVDRIAGVLSVVIGFSVFSSVAALDKLPGPDIVRWTVTAFLVFLPYIYITLGFSFPDLLISYINQLFFLIFPDYKERLLRHEAGHFLVGYLSGLPVLKYTVGSRLNAVQFYTPTRDLTQQPHKLGSLELNKMAVVSMAGVVAEFIRFGSGEGGYTDLVQLESLMDDVEPAPSEKQIKEKIRWGTLNAYTILKNNEACLDSLVKAMERGDDVLDCIKILEKTARP